MSASRRFCLSCLVIERGSGCRYGHLAWRPFGLLSGSGCLLGNSALQSGADAGQGLEAVLAGRLLQIAHRGDTEVLVDQAGSLRADARDLQQIRRVGRNLSL